LGKTVLAALEEAGYTWDSEKSLVRSPHFVSLIVEDTSQVAQLKIGFVNDTAQHYGGFSPSTFFPKIDSVRNILSNKLGAVFRYSAKDIADIWVIAQHEPFVWVDLLIEARTKDVGIDAVAIAEVLTGVPQTAFSDILWRSLAPTWPSFIADVQQIAHDLLTGEDNSLYRLS
jgi:hypothetical protein